MFQPKVGIIEFESGDGDAVCINAHYIVNFEQSKHGGANKVFITTADGAGHAVKATLAEVKDAVKAALTDQSVQMGRAMLENPMALVETVREAVQAGHEGFTDSPEYQEALEDERISKGFADRCMGKEGDQ